MKPFNLEEYLKNPDKKVITKDGRNARIVCTDSKRVYYPILALIDNRIFEGSILYTKNGEYILGEESSPDLFFAPEKKEGFVNVYRNAYGAYVLGEIFFSKEHKEVVTGLTYIVTAKIEWEE